MAGNTKRIRKRIGSSSPNFRKRDTIANDENRKLKPMLVAGVIYLAVASNIGSINALPLQNPFQSAPTFAAPTPSTIPWLWRKTTRPLRPRDDLPSRSSSSLGPLLQRHRRVHGTFLAAKGNSGKNGDGWIESYNGIATFIDETIDVRNVAKMDPEYRKYKRSLKILQPGYDADLDDEEDFEDDCNATPEETQLHAGSDVDKQLGDNEKSVGVIEKKKKKRKQKPLRPAVKDTPVHIKPLPGFNVVLTHCTADFDSLASAVGLAKLWSSQTPPNDGEEESNDEEDDYDSSTDSYPTFVVLPRGAHPAVQRFLALHKHLFPIRSLKSLPNLENLNRLALVDAQRIDRIGPAEVLLEHADRITVVDHHVDMESDIPGITDYVVDGVGSVSTLIVERLMRQQEKQLQRQLETSSSPITTLTEAEATLLALGIHADTGSLSFDSTTPRDASALAWVMHQGASQVAIAEHAQSSLSREQQAVLTQALVNANSTVAHGVTVSTVLLTADGFINGLAAVAQDALELSSADVFLLGVVYDPKAGKRRKGKKKSKGPGDHVKSKLLMTMKKIKPITEEVEAAESSNAAFPTKVMSPSVMYRSELARVAEESRMAQERLRHSFDQKDLDGNGFIDRKEMAAALVASGIIATEETVLGLMKSIDTNRDGLVDFDEFAAFASTVKSSLALKNKKQLSPSNDEASTSTPPHSSTLIIIGRVRAGVNMKSVKLGKLLEKYGGGGHPKAASATVRLNDEAEASGIMSDIVDELIETSLQKQATVGEFMTSPVLSVNADMSEKQVSDLFNRYDVRALPVVNDDDEVIGLVTYKEVSAAKQRMWNKEQKRLRQEEEEKKNAPDDANLSESETEEQKKQREFIEERRKKGPKVKAWMKQHVKTVPASKTMAEVEAILLENDVGCIPVVLDGTKQLVGMVTRTDLLRQHRYYPSLHYDNPGMSDLISNRGPIIALRKKLKRFDPD